MSSKRASQNYSKSEQTAEFKASNASNNNNKHNPVELPPLDEAADHNNGDDDDIDEEERRRRQQIIPALLMHAYHLPGNKYWQQDLWQYLTNNHPLFGICLHSRYHPLSWKIRLASLIGSVLFGLALTNVIYLAFVFTNYDDAYDKEYITLSTNITRTGLQEDFDNAVSSVSVTNGNLILWTVGATIHGFYDNIIWSLAACSCCMNHEDYASKTKRLQRYYRSTGALLVMLSVVLVTAGATFAVLLRAAIDADTAAEEKAEIYNVLESRNQVQQQLSAVKAQEFQDYKFVVSYLVELVFNYVVYYPVVGCILFSGILSCGRMPITGGRPYELRARREREKEGSGSDLEEQGVEVEWKSHRVEAKGTMRSKSGDEEESQSSTVSDSDVRQNSSAE